MSQVQAAIHVGVRKGNKVLPFAEKKVKELKHLISFVNDHQQYTSKTGNQYVQLLSAHSDVIFLASNMSLYFKELIHYEALSS